MRKQGTKNLTYYKRQQIETLLNANVDKKEIARIVGITLRTLYYEIKRGEYTHIKVLKNFWYGDKTIQTKNIVQTYHKKNIILLALLKEDH